MLSAIFSYGMKVNNSSVHTMYNGSCVNYALITDYSLYLQYKNIGVFGGYSTVYNGVGFFNRGYHAGLILNLYEHKHHAVNLYVYDTHYSYFYQNPSPAPQMLDDPGIISNYKNTITGFSDILSFNPRYKYTFLKGVLSVECGISFVFVIYHNNNASDNLPGFGANAALSFNPSALFHKH